MIVNEPGFVELILADEWKFKRQLEGGFHLGGHCGGNDDFDAFLFALLFRAG